MKTNRRKYYRCQNFERGNAVREESGKRHLKLYTNQNEIPTKKENAPTHAYLVRVTKRGF